MKFIRKYVDDIAPEDTILHTVNGSIRPVIVKFIEIYLHEHSEEEPMLRIYPYQHASFFMEYSDHCYVKVPEK